MSNLRQAAQQALEALENAYMVNSWAWVDQKQHVITALRAALAETRPIQECYGDCPTDPATCLNPCNFEGRPKPEQEPQTTHWEGCEAVHPECRKPEPVVQLEFAGTLPISRGGYAPTPRKPLTEDEIVDIWASVSMDYDDEINIIELARAIERHHGIGDSNAT